jgi:HEPN domain-containing protein
VEFASIHRLEAKILKKRSMEFLVQAEIAMNRGSYDVACFLAEQALQPYLKHILLILVGDYPRTYSIRRLLGEANRVIKSRELDEFIRANRILYSVLEDY